MGEPRRFAEGTKVSVDKTQGEIKALLGKHGATGFLLADNAEDGELVSVLMFRMQGRMLRYERRYPAAHAFRRDARGSLRSRSAVEAAQEAEWRRTWRALLLIIKAKLEIVGGGDSTFEREFLADIMLPEGGTVGDVLVPQLAESYENGSMPRLLPGGSL